MIFIFLLGCADLDGDGSPDRVDCADGDPTIHPDAEEICDQIDNNCDMLIDELDEVRGYIDQDGDGFYGTATTSVCAEVSATLDDCDDEASAIHPDAVEVCGDGVDNDCNGEIDDGDCGVIAYTVDGTQYLGQHLVVSVQDPQHWFYEELDAESTQLMHPGRLVLEDGSLTPAWRHTEADFLTHSAAVAVHQGEWLFSGGWLGGGGGLYALSPDGDDTLLASLTGGDGEAVISTSLWSDDESAYVAASLWASANFIVGIPEGEVGLEEAAQFQVVDDDTTQNLGAALLLLPDSGGDGIPDLLVSDPGWDKGPFSGIYLFDGTSAGTLTVDDADAALINQDHDGFGSVLVPAGDLNQDGYDDLLVSAWGGGTYGVFGPMDSWEPVAYADFTVAGNHVAGIHSYNGDDIPDLAVSLNHYGKLHIFAGPIDSGSYDFADADLEYPHHSNGDLNPIFVDVHGDGTISLIGGLPLENRIDDVYQGALQLYDLSSP